MIKQFPTLLLILSVSFSSGCILDALDRTSFPVWVDSRTNETVNATLEIVEVDAGKTVYLHMVTVPVGESVQAPHVRLPTGEYALRISTGQLEANFTELLGSSHTEWTTIIYPDSIDTGIGVT